MWFAAFGGFALGLGGVAILSRVGRARFARRVERETQALLENLPAAQALNLAQRMAELPAPLQRYLEFAIRGRQQTVTSVDMVHGGRFRLEPEQEFFAIRGEQTFTVIEPGFVWHASVTPKPFLAMEARDYYRAGRAGIDGRLWSSIPVVRAEGGGEVARAGLLRWLAESIWFPTAFVSTPGLSCEATGERSFRATLRDAGLEVSGEFQLNADGSVERFSALRGRELSGKLLETPWGGRYSDYRELDGMCVPFKAEVFWQLGGSDCDYARWQIESIRHRPSEC